MMLTYNAIYGSKSVAETLLTIDEVRDAYGGHGLEYQDDTFDIRDARVIAQRAVEYLKSIELFEPRKFSKHRKAQLAFLLDFVNACKEREKRLHSMRYPNVR
jgi:hypothetical protein